MSADRVEGSPDTTDTKRLFNWHPVLMTLAFGVFMAEAVMTYAAPVVPQAPRYDTHTHTHAHTRARTHAGKETENTRNAHAGAHMRRHTHHTRRERDRKHAQRTRRRACAHTHTHTHQGHVRNTTLQKGVCVCARAHTHMCVCVCLCRPLRKKIHASLHTAASVCALLGVWAAFESHWQKLPVPIPDLYSVHSYLGLTALILFAIQVCVTHTIHTHARTHTQTDTDIHTDTATQTDTRYPTPRARCSIFLYINACIQQQLGVHAHMCAIMSILWHICVCVSVYAVCGWVR